MRGGAMLELFGIIVAVCVVGLIVFEAIDRLR